MLRAAARRVGVDHGWRIGPGPGPVVAGDRPEVAGLGATSSGIEHRGDGLIDEELARSEQLFAHQGPDRLQLGGGVAGPVGQGGAVDLDVLALQALGLTVERGVVGVLGDQHLGHHPLGGQTALDQPRRRRGLDDPALAGAAGVLRATGDQDLILRGHDVEALGDIFADHMHGAGAAGTGRGRRLDHHLHVGQMIGQ
jgi:hypothetical protein